MVTYGGPRRLVMQWTTAALTHVVSDTERFVIVHACGPLNCIAIYPIFSSRLKTKQNGDVKQNGGIDTEAD